LDSKIGGVLSELERLGLNENTMVVYVGDHGYLLGHHGRFEKHTMWEPAVRSPLIIRGPGLLPAQSDALVEFIDLVPTILDYLDVPGLSTAQGKSLLPILAGSTDHHRDSVFSEFLPDNKAMIRTREWKYVFTSGKADLAMGYATGSPPSGILHKLYDVRKDPGEFYNLANEPEYETVVKELQDLMLQRFSQTHPYTDQLPQGLTLEEKLSWFCEPPEAALSGSDGSS
jgi:arylsulfatase A-like enzyme